MTNSKKEEPERIEELLFDTNESITIVSNFIKNFASKIDSEISNFKSTGINIIKEEKDLGNKYEITIIIDK